MTSNQFENSRIREGTLRTERPGGATTMKELLVYELRDLYDAQEQLMGALPRMAKAASSDQLRDFFEKHLRQTGKQIKRLERVFKVLGEKTTGGKCAAIAGLIEEANKVVSASDGGAVRNAGLVASARQVEHYEVSGYGSAWAYAEILGYGKAAPLLEGALVEEEEAHKNA